MKTTFLLSLAGSLTQVTAFWRLSCGQIQRGRLDPIITPGNVSAHAHVLAGAYNKSAYWTPMLYYRTKAGQYKNVPNSGTVVYYLPRGKGSENAVPFPKGFQMVSGNPFSRHYDSDTKAWGNATYPASPLADRVSFVCLKADYSGTRFAYMKDTDCANGLRAQITFPSCWDGVNNYKKDGSHVAYLSSIENGACPPTHKVRIPHLFFELYYFPNQLDTSDGGQFVFAQGDPTGYGFHGDFLNGWDAQTLQDGITQCLSANPSGVVESCPVFVPTFDSNASDNCPVQPSYYDEPVEGTLTALPGCNTIQPGPADATAPATCSQVPSRTNAQLNLDGIKRSWPTASVTKYNTAAGVATYQGCYKEPSSGRALTLASYADDSMTIENCAKFCQGKNAAVFGLEYGRECYCGNALPTTSKSADTTCNMACKGNISQWCGSGKLLNVYRVGGTKRRARRGLKKV